MQEEGFGVIPAGVVVADDVQSVGLQGATEHSTSGWVCVRGHEGEGAYVCVHLSVCLSRAACVFMCIYCMCVRVFTRAYSILSVQQPA